MQTTLQSALQDCLEKSTGPCAATIDGVSIMAFPGVSDETLKQFELTIQAWLQDAINAGLLPSQAEAWAIIEAAFKTYLSASVGPIAGRLILLGLKWVVADIYRRIDL